MPLLNNLQVLPLWEIGSPPAFQIYEYTNYKYERIFYSDGLSSPFKSYDKINMRLNSSSFLYHHMEKSYKCTIMLLFNFAESDWISTSCDEKQLRHPVLFK